MTTARIQAVKGALATKGLSSKSPKALHTLNPKALQSPTPTPQTNQQNTELSLDTFMLTRAQVTANGFAL